MVLWGYVLKYGYSCQFECAQILNLVCICLQVESAWIKHECCLGRSFICNHSKVLWMWAYQAIITEKKSVAKMASSLELFHGTSPSTKVALFSKTAQNSSKVKPLWLEFFLSDILLFWECCLKKPFSWNCWLNEGHVVLKCSLQYVGQEITRIETSDKCVKGDHLSEKPDCRGHSFLKNTVSDPEMIAPIQLKCIFFPIQFWQILDWNYIHNNHKRFPLWGKN